MGRLKPPKPALGMKHILDAGNYVLKLLVGDELQLPPFLCYDTYLNGSLFQIDSLFADFDSDFRHCGFETDYNESGTLRT